MPLVRILAISGSLHIASLNSVLLRAVICLPPSDVPVKLFTELGSLPRFNPDIEISDLPPVANFHARLLDADGVIIASQEYAHGVTGVIKSACMVGSEAFINKLVALLNASPQAIIGSEQGISIISPFQHQFARRYAYSMRRL